MSPWAKFLLAALADAKIFLSTWVSTRRETLVIQNQSTGCLVELSTVHYDCHERETNVSVNPVTLQFGLDCRDMQDQMKLDVTDGKQQCAKLELATSGSKAALPFSRSFRLEKGNLANLHCSIFPLKVVWSPDDKAFRYDLTLDFALRSAVPSTESAFEMSEISQISVVQLVLSSSVEIEESSLKEDCKRRLESLYEWKVDKSFGHREDVIEIRWESWFSLFNYGKRNVLKYRVNADSEWQVVSRVTFDDLQPKILMADVDPGHQDVKEHVTLKASTDYADSDKGNKVRALLRIDEAQLPPDTRSCEITLGYSYPGGGMEWKVIRALLSVVQRRFFKQVFCIVALLVAIAGLYYCRSYRSRAVVASARAASRTYRAARALPPSQSATTAHSMNIELS